MTITIKDIILQHKTNINLNNVSKKLKETKIFSDDGMAYITDENITTEDISKPKHTTRIYNNKSIDEYTYKIKEYTIVIDFVPEDYRSIGVAVTEPRPDDPYQTSITYRFNYKGEQWGLKY